MIKQKIFLDRKDGCIMTYPNLYKTFAPTELDINELELRQEAIKLFGKTIHQPRLSSFFGDENVSYKYSGRIFQANKWTPYLLNMKEKIMEDLDLHFNSVLVNYYRDEKDSMGLHADDEPELGHNPTIVSVSFGETRRMIFRHKRSKEKLEIFLNDGDVLLMDGAIQHNWKHELPKERKACKPRINLTYRQIL